VGDEPRRTVVFHSPRPASGKWIHRKLQWTIARRMLECGVVCFAAGRAAEISEVPSALQSRTAAQRFSRSNAGGIRGVAQACDRKD